MLFPKQREYEMESSLTELEPSEESIEPMYSEVIIDMNKVKRDQAEQ